MIGGIERLVLPGLLSVGVMGERVDVCVMGWMRASLSLLL